MYILGSRNGKDMRLAGTSIETALLNGTGGVKVAEMTHSMIVELSDRRTDKREGRTPDRKG